MNNFVFITAEKYWDLIKEYHARSQFHSLKEVEAVAKSEAGDCMVCDEQEWKLGGTGLCFSCTTGEADASEDYELI